MIKAMIEFIHLTIVTDFDSCAIYQHIQHCHHDYNFLTFSDGYHVYED